MTDTKEYNINMSKCILKKIWRFEWQIQKELGADESTRNSEKVDDGSEIPERR